jgi:hypothetical protein
MLGLNSPSIVSIQQIYLCLAIERIPPSYAAILGMSASQYNQIRNIDGEHG